MPVFEESDYRFTLPDDRSFRLGDCSTYVHRLMGMRMKEMDFGWIAPDGDAVWLLEVKNFDRPRAEPFDRDELITRRDGNERRRSAQKERLKHPNTCIAL